MISNTNHHVYINLQSSNSDLKVKLQYFYVKKKTSWVGINCVQTRTEFFANTNRRETVTGSIQQFSNNMEKCCGGTQSKQ